ncbi:hypothetical protein ACFVU2_06385 [Leifsonia sp. NPDC058194]|uniref:hypothetical protein n=1 Tax=Leifsonia sp. NPDC058194 TaxID=3346374 RepID=UPI0036DE64E8
MSMSEPFLPAHEPPADADPREHDIDVDVDVIPDAPRIRGRHRADDAPDRVGEGRSPVRDDAAEPPFRTPEAHHGLTADELEHDLDTESE